jgi:hypothetical protein
MGEFKAAAEAAFPLPLQAAAAAGDDPRDCYMAGISSSEEEDENPGALDIMIYSDIFPCPSGGRGIIMYGLREAYEFPQLLPLHVKDENRSKGRPLAYVLLPIEIVANSSRSSSLPLLGNRCRSRRARTR